MTGSAGTAGPPPSPCPSPQSPASPPPAPATGSGRGHCWGGSHGVYRINEIEIGLIQNKTKSLKSRKRGELKLKK